MRIVLKIGSTLISKGPRIDHRWIRAKTAEVAALWKAGHEVVIISSGAVAAGMEIEGLQERPTDVLKLQLLSGVGQIKLIKYYKDYFRSNKIGVAQVLLTHHNFATNQERATVEQIMNAYLAQRTIPIVNENDLVNKEEWKKQFSVREICLSRHLMARLLSTLSRDNLVSAL